MSENIHEVVWPSIMPFKVVTQSEARTCAGCVAAMLCGTTLDHFKDVMGATPPWTEQDIAKFCYSLGVWVGPSVPAECFAGKWYETLKGQPAYLVVELSNGVMHGVVWNGEMVGDSLFIEVQSPENYKVSRIGLVNVF